MFKKGGEKTIKIIEILAKNAVNAVEQVASETGYKGRGEAGTGHELKSVLSLASTISA